MMTDNWFIWANKVFMANFCDRLGKMIKCKMSNCSSKNKIIALSAF